MRTYIVGSRQSELAMTQTELVIRELEKQARQQGIPCAFKIQTFVTKGDRILDVALSKVGGKGLFVKEIEQALLNGDIDMAVHSMKDVPSSLPDGLIIGAIPQRVDARDCLISLHNERLSELPLGAKVGTSSLRRAAQLLAYRDDLQTAWIRGNVGTRLKRLESEDYDAIILAAAGLQRLGWEHKISDVIPVDICLPAVGQGALGIECRAADADMLALLGLINDRETSRAVSAERSFLATLEGGCSTPLAAYAISRDDGTIALTGMVSSADGKDMLKETQVGDEAISLGQALANTLISRGAERILAEYRD